MRTRTEESSLAPKNPRSIPFLVDIEGLESRESAQSGRLEGLDGSDGWDALITGGVLVISSPPRPNIRMVEIRVRIQVTGLTVRVGLKCFL